MKKFLFLLLSVGLLLSACGSDEPKEENAVNDDQEVADSNDVEVEAVNDEEDLSEEESVAEEDNLSDEEKEAIDADQVRELLEHSVLGETDELKDVMIEDEEIKAVIEIGENELIDDPSMLAETVYSRAGEELLPYEGWNVLTIEFVDIGTVSMEREQKEENEFGEYFPTEEIMKQLE